MHLVSLARPARARRGAPFTFAAGETIHTENCYKYTPTVFLRMAHAAHWRCERSWQDGGRTGFTVSPLAARELSGAVAGALA